MARQSVLVIKLGALGDLVQALGPFAAIRSHHPDATITLMTTAPYASFAEAAPYFDRVWVDRRPKLHQAPQWLALRRRLRAERFQRVYDLQTSDRSGFYFRLFWPGPWPEWIGIARGCSHPHANPERDRIHTVERQAEQLRVAGIDRVPLPDLSWATTSATEDARHLGARTPYALLAPGGAPHRPDKRWCAERFVAVAKHLAAHRIQPVLLGAAAEKDLQERIRAGCPSALGLAGKTTLLELAGLARGAVVAIGNDTGPMHLAAAAGCPSVVLFSQASDPALCGPRGRSVGYIRRADLNEVDVGQVLEAAWSVADTPPLSRAARGQARDGQRLLD